MEPSIGRREASKRATRAAIEQAARELFAQRGFDAVTVREIAERAGVTERTFYRYFPSKHELVADDARAWAQVLRAAIRDRPRSEAPLEAVHLAV
ncbi:MAG: TetR family transcriptional regulator, partial [Solirubrobacteraceae bacterium]